MQNMHPPENVVKDVAAQTSHRLNSPRWFHREHDMTIRSLGEYLLPVFLAAMEACWLNGCLIVLAGLNFLDASTALLPFWGPFVLILTALWLFRFALQKESRAAEEGETEATARPLLAASEIRLLFGATSVIAIFLVWLHIYSPSYALFDPAWLLALGEDVLALNWKFYQFIAILASTILLCREGMRLAQLHVEPGHVFRQIWTGLLVFFLAVPLRASLASASQSFDDVILLLLIPIFLYFSLSAHALARITFIRREHPTGLDGSILDQERAMLSVITLVGLVLLLITLIGGSFLSPAFFNTLQPVWHVLAIAYNGLVNFLAQAIVFVMTPFFWLANWTLSLLPPSKANVNTLKAPKAPPPRPLNIDLSHSTLLLPVKITLPLLLLGLLILLIYLTLRRRKRLKLAINRRGSDLHESIWSWSLFKKQLLAFWLVLWRGLFRHRTSETEQQVGQAEEIKAPPTVRTIREIYRLLLRTAARRGYPRKRDETPYEFQHRLDEHAPESEPQLGQITEAYMLVRYGGQEPDEQELDFTHQVWSELSQKWKIS